MKQLVTPKLSKRSNLGVSFYTDDDLCAQTGVRIAFTCRIGGVSGVLGDLNLAGHVGDNIDDVKENRLRVLNALEIDSNCPIATLNQVHGNDVVVVKRPLDIDADGMVVPSGASDVVGMMFYADCMPVAIVSPSGSFALVHAGWRGVYNKIVLQALNTLRELDESLNASFNPADCNVYIGPHIHKECFEVSAELAQDFASAFGEDVVYGERNVNLLLAMQKTLVSAGFSTERICDIDKCTVCANDEFFSYRAEDGACGRHALLGTGLFWR